MPQTRKRVRGLFAFLVIVSILCAPPSWSRDADALNREVIQLYQQGRYEEAARIAEEVVTLRKSRAAANPAEYSVSLNNLALLYKSMGKYEKAAPLYKESMAVWKRIVGENHPNYALGLNNLAELYRSMGRYAEAEPLLLKAMQIRKRHLGDKHPDYATTLNSLSALYVSTDQYAKAEPLLKETIAIRKRVLGENHPDYAVSLNNLAYLYKCMGEFPQAETLYLQAMDVRKRALGEGHPAYAQSLNNLASLYVSMGEYGKAERFLKKALDLRKSVLGEKHPDYATSLNNLGEFYRTLAEYAEAEPLFRKALVIKKEALGEKHGEYASCLNNLALLYMAMGEFGKAEPLLLEVKSIDVSTLRKKSPEYAQSLDNLAALHQSIGEYDKARRLLQESVSIRKEVLGPNHPDYALSLDNLAGLCRVTGNLDEAEPLLREAMTVMKAALGEGHPDYARSVNDLATLYEAMGRYDEAEPLYRRTLAIREKALGQKHPACAQSLNNLAGLYAAMGDYDKAEPLYREALSIVMEAGEPQSACTVSCNLGELLRLADRPREAVSSLKRGIEYFEQVRGKIGEGSRRAKFQAAHGNYYDNLAAASLAMGAESEAFNALERRRAKSFLDLLATEELVASSRNDTTYAKSAQLDRLEREYRALSEERDSWTLESSGPVGQKTRSAPETVERKMGAMERQRLELIEEIRRADAELGSLICVDAPTLEEVQSFLGDGVVLVEYHHPGEMKYPDGKKRNELWVFVITRNSLHFERVDVSRETLEAELEAFVRVLEAGDTDLPKLRSLSGGLYSRLIQPIEKLLGHEALVVIPWGPMYKIPFGALNADNGEVLVASHRMVVSPSAGVYRYLLNKRRSGRSRIFAVGNPVTALSPLPGAEREAAEVASLFPKAVLRKRTEATETYVKQPLARLGSPDVVHLACHGIFNEIAPPLSYLALTPDGENDGNLEMHELFGLDWRGVSLVSLSACSSGKGKLGAGDDLVGLTRALMFAGAPSVLCSLWDVDDEATRELMRGFYENYLSGHDKSESLRLAKLSLMKRAEWSHPYYWSAFVLYGDWQ